MADEQRGPVQEKYEAPLVRELGTMDELTSGADADSVGTTGTI